MNRTSDYKIGKNYFYLILMNYRLITYTQFKNYMFAQTSLSQFKLANKQRTSKKLNTSLSSFKVSKSLVKSHQNADKIQIQKLNFTTTFSKQSFLPPHSLRNKKTGAHLALANFTFTQDQFNKLSQPIFFNNQNNDDQQIKRYQPLLSSKRRAAKHKIQIKAKIAFKQLIKKQQDSKSKIIERSQVEHLNQLLQNTQRRKAQKTHGYLENAKFSQNLGYNSNMSQFIQYQKHQIKQQIKTVQTSKAQQKEKVSNKNNIQKTRYEQEQEVGKQENKEKQSLYAKLKQQQRKRIVQQQRRKQSQVIYKQKRTIEEMLKNSKSNKQVLKANRINQKQQIIQKTKFSESSILAQNQHQKSANVSGKTFNNQSLTKPVLSKRQNQVFHDQVNQIIQSANNQLKKKNSFNLQQVQELQSYNLDKKTQHKANTQNTQNTQNKTSPSLLQFDQKSKQNGSINLQKQVNSQQNNKSKANKQVLQTLQKPNNIKQTKPVKLDTITI